MSLEAPNALTSNERPNPLFAALARWVLGHQHITLGITFIITALSIFGIINNLKLNNNLEVFTPAESEVIKRRNLYRDLFESDEVFLVSARGDVFSETYLKRVQALESEIERINLELDTEGRERVERTRSRSGLNINDVTSELELDLELFAVDEEVEGELKEKEKGEKEEGEKEREIELRNRERNSRDQDASQGAGSVIEEITSIVSVRRTAHLEGAVYIKPWFNPIPTQTELDTLKPLALADPLLAQRLVNQDGTLSLLMVRPTVMTDDDMFKVAHLLNEIISRHTREGFKLSVTGSSAVASALNDVVLSDLNLLLMLSGLAMLIALIYLFRTPILVLGPLAVVLIAMLWTLGFMALTDMSINLLSSILPAFLLCVGLGDSIHVQSIFKSCRDEGMGVRDAVIQACGLTGPPVLFTSLTTMIGLFSFKFATVNAIQDMGYAGGMGVIFAFLHSVITLPIFLSWHTEPSAESSAESNAESNAESSAELYVESTRQGVSNVHATLTEHHKPKHDGIDRALAALVSASANARGRAIVFALAFILAMVSAYGVSSLRVWHDDLSTLPADNPTRLSVIEVDQELGGIANVRVIIEAEELKWGVKNLELLHALDALAEHTLSYRTPEGEAIVGHAVGLTNIVKESHRAFTGDAELYALPKLGSPRAQSKTSELIGLFDQSPDQVRKIATIDMKNTHLTLQVKWQESTSYEGLIKHIDAGVERFLRPLAERGVKTSITGGVYISFTVVSALLDDLIKSFSAAFIVITLLMVLMLRSFKLGMLAMVPNLFPILLMLGALGLIGIPIDLNNLLIASIALGIAVDDTIHLLHHFQVSYERHGRRERAIKESLRHAGRAMLSTSILLSVGFSMNYFALTTGIRRFGVIIAITVLVALIVDLLICPALLRVAYPEHNPDFDLESAPEIEI